MLSSLHQSGWWPHRIRRSADYRNHLGIDVRNVHIRAAGSHGNVPRLGACGCDVGYDGVRNGVDNRNILELRQGIHIGAVGKYGNVPRIAADGYVVTTVFVAILMTETELEPRSQRMQMHRQG